jgi:hypothetical protein
VQLFWQKLLGKKKAPANQRLSRGNTQGKGIARNQFSELFARLADKSIHRINRDGVLANLFFLHGGYFLTEVLPAGMMFKITAAKPNQVATSLASSKPYAPTTAPTAINTR